ncbi:RNA polymerase factor sigma-54 [Armatimonas sp.]|uniref:RNA polymerase factor sigma-54 n=1 Tax=Armatimonas sp. TaxID=1872638 RepID=UPI00286B1E50|nr:RNA polymerase factor sigma-54 [Armatimonas sp.]
MRLSQTIDARQQQTQRIDPRQILASEILAWTTEELEVAIERELAENPALEARENETFTLSTPVSESPALTVTVGGKQDDPPATSERTQPTLQITDGGLDSEDPFDRVASNTSLREHLRSQVGHAKGEVAEEILRYLIENVDDRGYLIADTNEIAERFQLARSRVEEAVKALQTMDPAGVGARDLHECLLLQMEYLELTGEGHALSKKILLRCWDELVARRDDRIASRLKASVSEVNRALRFLQQALTPYPGALFRPSDHRASASAPLVRPDILFLRTEAGFAVELARDFEQVVSVAPLWKRLADGNETHSDEAMRRYIRDHVDRAQNFMAGVSRRGRTLRAIAHEIVRVQQGYLETRNRAFLKPLTRQTLAEKLHLDESVISRAVADKWVQLPNGEILPLDTFFGNSQAVREALLHLISSENSNDPYSDDEIAVILTEQGFPLARRTVAKYRGIERILPARLRKRKAA